MKRQEGVTLIALAVTIIVMLILAGVSISTYRPARMPVGLGLEYF